MEHSVRGNQGKTSRVDPQAEPSAHHEHDNQRGNDGDDTNEHLKIFASILDRQGLGLPRVGGDLNGLRQYIRHVHNKQYNTEMMHSEILMNNVNKSWIFGRLQAEMQ